MKKLRPVVHPVRMRSFFSILRATGNVAAAARGAGISRWKAYELRREDEEFRRAWDDAVEEALDDLEQELRRRAIEGTEKPYYYGGRQCGAAKTYSDRLGMFLLKGRRHEVFGAARGKPQSGHTETALPASPRERLLQRLAAMRGQT